MPVMLFCIGKSDGQNRHRFYPSSFIIESKSKGEDKRMVMPKIDGLKIEKWDFIISDYERKYPW